jgi:hypothetical protein
MVELYFYSIIQGVSIISGTSAATCTVVVVVNATVDDSTRISLESVSNISRRWMDVLIFCYFIWSSVPGLMKFCDGSDKGTASNFVQISKKVWQRPWQCLDKCLRNKA